MDSMNWLLFSGGLDSTVIFSQLVKDKKSFTAVFVDYGQKSKQEELKVVEYYCKEFDVPLIKHSHNICKSNDFYFKGRNLYLISLCATFAKKGDSIFAGFNRSDASDFPDCTYDFTLHLKECLQKGYGVKLVTPLLPFTKQEIKTLGKELTYSYCYEPIDSLPCGKCLSCLTHKG